MSRKVSALAALSVAAWLNAGCATIVSGTSQTITIDSNPPGAFVKIGHQTGTTPVTMRIPKGQDYPIEVSRYSDQRIIQLDQTMDPATLLNAIPPLWPGFIVDAWTGCLKHYDPNVIIVDFTQEPPTPRAQLTGYRVTGERR